MQNIARSMTKQRTTSSNLIEKRRLYIRKLLKSVKAKYNSIISGAGLFFSFCKRNDDNIVSGSTQAEAGKNSDSDGRRSGNESSPSAAARTNNQPNYRVALRNGNLNQPRRHYSIIPQLFISYGWGPSGK